MASNRRVIWATLSLDLFLWGLLNSIFGPSSLRIMGEFNADFATVGIAVSAMSFGAMFSIFTGRYADKYGSYYISRLSLFFLGLATFLTGFTNSILLYIVLSFLAGISIGTFQASFTQAILDLYPDAKLKMLSFNAAFFGVGATIGPTVTALLISSFNDWRIAYMLFGGLLTASVFFQFSLKSAGKEITTPSIDKRKQKSDSFLVLLIALFFMFVMGSGVNSWLPTYIVTANKADYLEASALLSCFWAAGTVMRGLVWKIIDKAGEKKVLVYFALVGSISSFISLFLIGFVPNAVVWGVVGLAYVPLNPLVMAVAYSKYRHNPGRVIGRLVSFGNFGALISAPLIGVINNISGPNIATLVIPISGLVVTLMFLKLKMD